MTVLRIPRDALEENLAADPGFSLRFYRALGMLLSTSPPRDDVTRIVQAPPSFRAGQVGRAGSYRYGQPIRRCLPGVPSATGLPGGRGMDHIR